MKQGIRTFCDICGDNILSSSRGYYKRQDEVRKDLTSDIDICDNCIKVYWYQRAKNDVAQLVAKNTFKKVDNETD